MRPQLAPESWGRFFCPSQIQNRPLAHNAPKLNNAWWRGTRTGNCNPPVPLSLRRLPKVQWAWNDLWAGSLDSTALGGVERKEPRRGNKPPPSGVLLGGLSKYPRAGAVSFVQRGSPARWRLAETAFHSKCAFFFCGMISAAILGQLAALSRPGRAVGPIRVTDQ
jgi:hypothetical protein